MTEPTKIKMWRAVRVTPPKFPQTLADCDEGRLAIFDTRQFGLVIRKRVGSIQRTSNELTTYFTDSEWEFIRYLDDPQTTAPPDPITFGELRDGQCFRFSPVHHVMWRAHNECMWVLVSGKIGSNKPETDEPIEFIPDIEMVLEEQPCN